MAAAAHCLVWSNELAFRQGTDVQVARTGLEAVLGWK
ncbi:hypothetical protein SSU98_0460 [Streptococcus suis 98HAH33]|nr:hypothetical protein SSU98_0460 [Streptococcus suis 98HAH33]